MEEDVQDGGIQGFQFGGKRRKTRKSKKTYKRRKTKGKKTRRH